jgi:hypothetical protein
MMQPYLYISCQYKLIFKRFSSAEGEEDQNAAWLEFNLFNKDHTREHYKTTNVKKPETVLSGAMTQRQETITHKIRKEHGCLNMVPNQRQ